MKCALCLNYWQRSLRLNVYQNTKWILTRSDNRRGQKPWGRRFAYKRVFASSLYQQGIINRSWVFVRPITGPGGSDSGRGQLKQPASLENSSELEQQWQQVASSGLGKGWGWENSALCRYDRPSATEYWPLSRLPHRPLICLKTGNLRSRTVSNSFWQKSEIQE